MIRNRFGGAVLFLLIQTGALAADDTGSGIELLSYRLRADFGAALNADEGWAALENTSAALNYDQPFRLRVQVRAAATVPQGHLLNLQYRWQGGAWSTVGVARFPYPSLASPLLSVTATEAYADGEETRRLLGDPTLEWDAGAGLNLTAATPVWRGGGDTVEWEWPLVARRFSDGPTFAENGANIELRLVDGGGLPLAGPRMSAQFSAAPGHLGGTFIETPARIGPYQTDDGTLYFFMEPAETDNRFMAVMSTDYGQSWREADGAARPSVSDLEGVASVRIGSIVHIIHQVSHEVFYHAFELADAGAGHWLVNSESIAKPEGEPPTQIADVIARSDGSLLALYGGARRLFLQIRSARGEWGAPVEIDAAIEPALSGAVLALGKDDAVTLAYTGRDGRGFIRHLFVDGTLSERLTLSSKLGASEAEDAVILPLVALPDSGTSVVLYRETDGFLYERRFTPEGELSTPIQVSNTAVITNAVDSEQVGADLVLHDGTLHLLFIDAERRSIQYTRSDMAGRWAEPTAVVEGIEASWLRGSIHRDAEGNAVYGFVYDAGSKGGSGFNEYKALPL
ncbi:MAG: hypothetical protein LBE21_08160 [Pseudomonadales bacterium]|jgi:hypothetical protein|nr:hypothetical protein [Pseudomonadales bacterium]